VLEADVDDGVEARLLGVEVVSVKGDDALQHGTFSPDEDEPLF